MLVDVLVEVAEMMIRANPKRDWTLWDVFKFLYIKNSYRGKDMKRFPTPENIAMLIEKGLSEREIAAELFEGNLTLTRFMLEEMKDGESEFRGPRRPLQESNGDTEITGSL